MRKIVVWMSAVALVGALMPVSVPIASGNTGDPVLINEVLASHVGTDNTEYFELYGTPGTRLAGLSLIVIESDEFGPGQVDRRFDFKPFHAIGPNGFFLAGNCSGLSINYQVTPDAGLFNNYFEQSSLTVALVESASAPAQGDSVDGTEVVLDAVALTDGDTGDTFFFGAPVIGPDGQFFPAGVRRIDDGVDTDTVSDWVISDFFLGGANTPTPGGFDGCAPIPLSIPEIQGDGQFSDFNGEVVTTSGVVTAISASGRDGFIQDPTGDGDPSTSDGIFVDDFQNLSDVSVGDEITITGTAEELQFGNALPLTQVNNPTLESIDSSGNALPAPVVLADQPNFSVDEATSSLERLEGMLVSVGDATVVGPTNQFGEFAMLANKDAKPGSGYFSQAKQILLRSTAPNEVDYNPERILVDDLTLGEAIQVSPGDKVKSMVGVLDYTFGNYKIQPTAFEVKPNPIKTKSPLSTRSGQNGDVVITTFNVENLFDLVDDPVKDDSGSTPSPEELTTKLTKLALAIELELRLPEILILQEVENTAIAQQLGNRVNASAGTDYIAVSFETSDARGIEVAFLLDRARVDLIEAFQLSGPDVEAAFGPSSASPGREPLYGRFVIGDEEVHIVGNHFKSKGGDDPIFGVSFVRVTEAQRKMQAQVVADFVSGILDEDPDAKVMIAGDLNDFQFGEPGEGTDHPVSILEGAGSGFTNLIDLEKDAERWTFVFDGNSQVLDHMLVNDSLLAHLAGTDILHFNAAYASSLGEDPTTAVRASDHDPVEGRFNLTR